METVEHIVYGDYLITMAHGAGDLPDIIRNGAVAVKNGLIVDVGPEADVRKRCDAKHQTGGRGRAVIPGLVNTHTHAAMVFMRGLADDLPLREWLDRHIWPVENRWLGEDFITDAVELACIEMLKAGVTTFNDMYFFEDVAAGVVKRLGMRAVLGAGIVDFPTKTTSGADDCLKKAERFIAQWRGDALITPAVAPHAAYTCGPDTLKRSASLARENEIPLHVHVAETQWEVSEVRSKYGKTPGHHLEALGLLDGRLTAAHCVWLTEDEIELFAKRGVSVAHCVESNLKLSAGIAPVPAMLKAGINVTFGTDGAASNNDLNVLGEMATAAKLHKGVTGDPTVLDAQTVFEMATLRGARALGLNAGSLQPGKMADIVVINLDAPHLSPLYNVFSHLVYSARPSDVEAVMVGGRLVVDGGELLTAHEEEILMKARAWGERIIAR